MAFSFYRTITIDKTKVPNTNQTDFPVLVSGTYTYLKTTGNGGDVQNSNGYDIGFYSDSALTTKLKWETEKYVATTGEVVYWVKVPTVSTSVDTVIYLAYGDSGITTDQSDKTNVWDSNFLGVWHMNDTSSPAQDSTTNNIDMASETTASYSQTGKIGDAIDFNGTDGGLRTYNDFTAYNKGTITAWYKGDFVNSQKVMWAQGWPYVLGGFNMVFVNDGNVGNIPSIAISLDDTTNRNAKYTALGVSTETWTKIDVVVDYTASVSNQIKVYINGVNQSLTTYTGLNTAVTGNFSVYWFNWARQFPASSFWDGTIDEGRFSISTRSADWLATEYNNQNSPATFYTVGSQQTPGGGGAVTNPAFLLNFV